MAVKNVIAQHQRAGAASYEVLSHVKRLRQSARMWLYGIRKIDAPLTAAAQASAQNGECPVASK